MREENVLNDLVRDLHYIKTNLEIIWRIGMAYRIYVKFYGSAGHKLNNSLVMGSSSHYVPLCDLLKPENRNRNYIYVPMYTNCPTR